MTLFKLSLFFTLASLFTPTPILAITCHAALGDDDMCQAFAEAKGCAIGYCNSAYNGACVDLGCPR